MGGGGLAFLNKKTWHPGRLDNQEEKWKREQAAAKEKAKLNELQKQIAMERQQEELHAVAQAAGVKEASNRLDWMYAGGMVAKAEADKRSEEQLLGQRAVDLGNAAAAAAPSQPDAVQLPTFYAEDTAASANEVWSRIHSDPLFAIRQQEIATRKSIAANPVKMDAIKKEVAKLKAAEEAGKAQRKAEKRAKKEAKAARKAEKKAAKAPPAAVVQPPAPTNGHGEPARKRARSTSPNGQAARPERHGRQALFLEEARNGHSERNGHARSNGHGEHRHHDDRDRDRNGHREGDRHGYRSGRDKDEAAAANGHGSKQHHGGGRHEREEEARPRVHIDGASAQRGADLKYGLNYGGTAPEALQGHDRSELAAATQKRLDEAAKKKEEEEREKAAQRHVRRDYKTGRMTEEERAARLAEMSGNASVHEEARWARQKRAREADDSEEAANALQPTDDEQRKGTAAFLKEATKEVYGASGEAASLADRVGRRKHYAESRGDVAFRR